MKFSSGLPTEVSSFGVFVDIFGFKRNKNIQSLWCHMFGNRTEVFSPEQMYLFHTKFDVDVKNL